MGTDKRHLALGDKALLDQVLSVLTPTGYNVLRIEQDEHPNQGPIGGVETALLQAREDWILFVPCDMPFLTEALLRRVLQAAQSDNRSAFADVKGRIGFPFALRRFDLSAVQQRLQAGERSLHGLAAALDAIRVEFPLDQAWRFHNINDPEDLERARELWEKARQSG